MANNSSFPDVFSWIKKVQVIQQWQTNQNSINLCPSLANSPNPSLKLSVNNFTNSHVSLSIFADYNHHPVSLWTSKKLLITGDDIIISTMVSNFIEDVLNYCSNKCPSSSSHKLPRRYPEESLKDIFNLSFLTLTFIICIYEAPRDLRGSCLNALKEQLACPKSRGVSQVLMRVLGSNTEEEWMRSLNLAITNWISELNMAIKLTPSPLFSYSVSMRGLWKLQLYCPLIAMDIVEKSSGSSPDERLLYSLNFHHLEGVIQLNYKLALQDKWIEIKMNTDNIRCDVVKLLTDRLMKERGAGTSEKHFPSRIALQITPRMQANVISVSVSKSSENPRREIGAEKGIEASFEPPTGIGLHFSAGESTTTSVRPWKFEQSVYGNTGNLNWYLHDSEDGREVFSSKPSKLALLQPKAWFKNRYSSASRPFTRQGGVVFAGDQYGESVSWKVDKGCMGRVVEWEIKGWIWLTYWPNKHRTFYTETRRLEFREILHSTLL